MLFQSQSRMPGQRIEFDAGSYRELMEWEQTCHRILDLSSRLETNNVTEILWILTEHICSHLRCRCLSWLVKTCSPSPIQLLEEEWEERPDWASSGLSNLPMCVFIQCTAKQASINLHRLSKHSHELFSLDKGTGASFCLLLLPFFKSPSCWIHSEYKTFCRKSPNHFFLFQLA